MPAPTARLKLPGGRRLGPLTAIGLRLGIALALVLVVWGLVLLERDGYRDSADGRVSAVDALYYTTVTLSTTGYGDITPVATRARLVNALIVTPMRIVFVIVLVGTTIQALTQRSRTEFRLARWRSRMHDHVIVVGYGTKGRNVVRALRLQGHRPDRILVVDADPRAAEDATADGYVAVTGSATRAETYRAALAERAASAVVALDRDDTAILATLALKRLAPHLSIVAAAREAEHADLLRQSGAGSVVVSSETTGRLLGLATDSPAAVDVVEDLVSFGRGLDLTDRPVAAAEVGSRPSDLSVPVLAVVRSGRTHLYNDPSLGTLRADDRVVLVVAPPPA